MVNQCLVHYTMINLVAIYHHQSYYNIIDYISCATHYIPTPSFKLGDLLILCFKSSLYILLQIFCHICFANSRLWLAFLVS